MYFLRNAFVLMAVLTVLHFSLVGITLLNSSVETARFDVGASGLLGLPSRAVLYGTPALTLLSLATLRPATRRVTLAIWILFAASQVALGFKGALAEVLVVSAMGWFLGNRRLRLGPMLLMALGGAAAISYVQFVGSRYATMTGSNAGFGYVVNRVTTEAIRAGYTALSVPPGSFSGSVFVSDAQTLIARYDGSSSGGYTFDELVSSTMTGTHLQAGAFIVPVTVGGPVYLYFSFSALGAVVLLFLLGMAWAVLAIRIGAPKSALSASFIAVSLYGIRVFLLNGNGAYLVINLAFTGVLLSLCGLPILVRSWKRQPSRVVRRERPELPGTVSE